MPACAAYLLLCLLALQIYCVCSYVYTVSVFCCAGPFVLFATMAESQVATPCKRRATYCAQAT